MGMCVCIGCAEPVPVSKVKFLTVPDRKPFWIWTCVIPGHTCSHWTCVERGLGTGSAPQPDLLYMVMRNDGAVDTDHYYSALPPRSIRRTKRITTSDHENNIVLSPLAPPRSRQANRGPRQSTCLCLKYRTVLTAILH